MRHPEFAARDVSDAFKAMPDGALSLATDSDNGRVIRIGPKKG